VNASTTTNDVGDEVGWDLSRQSHSPILSSKGRSSLFTRASPGPCVSPRTRFPPPFCDPFRPTSIFLTSSLPLRRVACYPFVPRLTPQPMFDILFSYVYDDHVRSRFPSMNTLNEPFLSTSHLHLHCRSPVGPRVNLWPINGEVAWIGSSPYSSNIPLRARRKLVTTNR